ncbi:hypothetical protein Nepgr_017718 [Nepenthes gracilis]|uniref:GDSL esterase/lipase n=1 Tax=Nepenthes gracilis TaxID=150966 RepID=A0AAD3SRM1_NEPGR|nr:hypothetical protein Nepgr_017718 [Nepenthes gracilis]
MAKRLWVVLWVALVPKLLEGVTVGELRNSTGGDSFRCLLVFGDSSVDPGNNNNLKTSVKSNYPPYGKDFIHGRPTGRFSDGRLATDFIVEALGHRKGVLPAFLDPTLRQEDLPYGVSFASAGSGYDDLTADLAGVLRVSRQLEYLKHYKIHLRKVVGDYDRAEEVISKGVFVISLGSNDLLQNYFVEPIRPKQFTLQGYTHYLVSRMLRYLQEMQRQGARRVIVVGVPPLGCMPIVRTLEGNGSQRCVESINGAAFSLNSKIQREIRAANALLNMKIVYADIYSPIKRVVDNPRKYGFRETCKGCCGSGTYEYGDTCRGLSTCADPTEYVFWDAIHPTQRMYKVLADHILDSVTRDFFL